MNSQVLLAEICQILPLSLIDLAKVNTSSFILILIINISPQITQKVHLYLSIKWLQNGCKGLKSFKKPERSELKN